jgi:hypothetical protein
VCAAIVVDSSEPTNKNSPSHTDVPRTFDNCQSTTAVHPLIPTVEVTNGSPTPGSDANNTAVEHLDDWDTDDTASMSDTASISSGCSSVGSQGETLLLNISAYIWLTFSLKTTDITVTKPKGSTLLISLPLVTNLTYPLPIVNISPPTSPIITTCLQI